MKKKNAYVCPQLHITVTEDRDEGTTPMFIDCPNCPVLPSEKEEVKRMAVSLMYRINQNLNATHEWYKPTKSEMDDFFADMYPGAFQALHKHVKDGGLLIREKRGFKKLMELKDQWAVNQRLLVDDDYEETRERIRREVMDLHRENPELLAKEDFEYFGIQKKEVRND